MALQKDRMLKIPPYKPPTRLRVFKWPKKPIPKWNTLQKLEEDLKKEKAKSTTPVNHPWRGSYKASQIPKAKIEKPKIYWVLLDEENELWDYPMQNTQKSAIALKNNFKNLKVTLRVAKLIETK